MEKKQLLPEISFNYCRRFGLEIELNAFDGKNRPEGNKHPKGIEYVAGVVDRNCEEGVEIRAWESTSGNRCWVLKPDSSCGMELCSPPLKGWKGIKTCCQIVEAISREKQIQSDERCSVHLHIDVSDLDTEQLGAVIAWWIKAEPVMLDMVPKQRKRNRYCQFIGMTDLIDHSFNYSANDLINKIGQVKYYTLNTYNLKKSNGQKKTIEFRIVEGAGCRDAYLIKNWIRFIVHFIEKAYQKGMPPPYNPTSKDGVQWTGLSWLDPEDVLELLGFGTLHKQYELSKGLEQTRNWFLARMLQYIDKNPNGVRSYAYKDLKDIILRLSKDNVIIDPTEHLLPKELKYALYDENLKH